MPPHLFSPLSFEKMKCWVVEFEHGLELGLGNKFKLIFELELLVNFRSRLDLTQVKQNYKIDLDLIKKC